MKQSLNLKKLSLITLTVLNFKLFEYQYKNKFLSCKAILNKKKESDNSFFEKVDLNYINALYPQVSVLNFKSIDILLGIIRDKHCDIAVFRKTSSRIIRLIIEEALSRECDKEIIKESPIGTYKTYTNSIDYKDYIGVSILRSGNSMIDELISIVPEIKIGNVLVQRDESTKDKKPIYFFDKLPEDLINKRVFLVDPLLATGGSAIAVLEILVKKGIDPSNIVFLNIISCEEGLKQILKVFPQIKIITAAIDPVLMPNKYIAPGVGDFGDRYYGTEFKKI